MSTQTTYFEFAKRDYKYDKLIYEESGVVRRHSKTAKHAARL